MKLIKYTINEIVCNKLRIFLLLIMLGVVFFTLCNTVFSIIGYTKNINNEKVVNQDKSIIQNINLIPENYTPVAAENYYQFFKEISELDLDTYTYSSTVNFKTSDQKLSNEPEAEGMYSVNSLMASQELLVDLKVENFVGRKVILPNKFSNSYNIGDKIKFESMYYPNNKDDIISTQEYEIVAFYEENSKIIVPIKNTFNELHDEIIFAPLDIHFYDFEFIEYEAVAQDIILNSYIFSDSEDSENIAQDINDVGKKYGLNIRSANIIFAEKMSETAIKNTIKDKILVAVPIYVMFMLGISYVIKSILQRRMYFYSVITSLGASIEFIRVLMWITFLIVVIFALSVVILFYQMKLPEQVFIVGYLIVFFLIFVVFIPCIKKELKLLNIDKLKDTLKGKYD